MTPDNEMIIPITVLLIGMSILIWAFGSGGQGVSPIDNSTLTIQGTTYTIESFETCEQTEWKEYPTTKVKRCDEGDVLLRLKEK